MEIGSGPADAQENNNNNNKQNNSYIVGNNAKNDAFNLWDVMYYIYIIQCTKIRTHLASCGWTVFGVIFIVYFMYEQFEMHDYLSRPTQERPTALRSHRS